ncbi:receptor-like protein 13, partial [Quercus suber]
MQFLWSLDISNNFFEGEIPCEMHAYILIDLSHNRLSGLSTSCADLSIIQHLFLQGNRLTGPVPKVTFSVSFHLVTLDIRDNLFSGRIPYEVGELSNLRILLLSGNNFSGAIPKQLCWLKNLEIMDLSKNYLSGTIPQCFRNITFGKLNAIDAFDGLPQPNSTFLEFRHITIPYQGILNRYFEIYEVEQNAAADFGIEFVMKYRSVFYKGGILDIMSGLDLSFNKLTGEIPPELGQLSPILALNLSYNQLMGFILTTFSNLTQLESLDLSHNNLSGEIPSILIDLHFLEVFNVAYNNLSGKVPDMKGQFGTFQNSSYEGKAFLCGPPLEKSCTRVDNSPPLPIKSLTTNPLVFSTSVWVSYVIFFIGVSCILYINPNWQQWCFNLIEYQMYRFLSALPALKSLDLSSNDYMEGPLSSNDMANFSNLEILDLSGNVFTGGIPPYIGALSSLKAISLSDMELVEIKMQARRRLLDISHNRFNGNLSSSLIANLTFLEYIDLSYNLFEGLFSFSLFANLSKLKVIQILSDKNKLDIEIENSNRDPMFQLQVLVMSNCNLNKPTSTIPKFLFYQHELEVVALSHSKLKGNFPIWLLKNNTRLKLLNLWNNYLDCQFHLPPDNCKNLTWLGVSGNHLDGQLQENIGKVPMELVTNCTSLKILRLSNNNFHGEFFSKHFSQSFFSLELNNNHFTGTLPKAPLSFCILDISNNHMLGIIPLWMGNDIVTLSGIIDLSNNFFEGQLPCGLECKASNFTREQSHKNIITKVVLNSLSLLTLDIRDNRFFGSIPEEVDRLSNLRVLLLSGNHFSGMIPKKLCQLEKIGIMDLSRNYFSGTIPYCFRKITFGQIATSEFVYINDASFSAYGFSLPYKSLLNNDHQIQGTEFGFKKQVEIDFLTKYRSNLYMGLILDIMSALDMSFNQLIGGIPLELGQLSSIHSLNLSHNQLTGPIPKTFSNLTQLESLDLSYNNLSGEIPSTLIALNFLEIFSGTRNNLSGKVPDFNAQFGTFDKNGYRGNPFLCGPPLEKRCIMLDESPSSPRQYSNASDEKWYEVDPVVFYTSLSLVFFVLILTGNNDALTWLRI